MTPHALNIADFGMDTLSMPGSLAHKLAAVRGAGFSQVMLSASDLVNHADGVDAAVRLVEASGLRITGLQGLRDYEGLADRWHDYKVEAAKSLLGLCRAVGAPLLVVGSSTAAEANGEPERSARDLRKLAMLAVPLGVRIGYEALASGRHVRDFNAAWDIVCRADAPNLGLVLDACHLLAAGSPLEDIDFLDPDKVFLVQLADFLWDTDAASAAPPARVFPREGAHSEQLAELVLRLRQLGYRGDHSFEVGNDDHLQTPPPALAARARAAAIWLGEDVLHLSTPLPGQMRLRRA